MEEHDLTHLLAGKQHRRQALARQPIEEKLRAVVRLQEMAAPILRQRGKTVRCWILEAPPLDEVGEESDSLLLREEPPEQ